MAKKEQTEKKIADGTMHFLVPPELAPGVARSGVGFFPPASTLKLPDAASRPGEFVNMLLEPLNEAAEEQLEKQLNEIEARREARLLERKKGAVLRPAKLDKEKAAAIIEADNEAQKAKRKKKLSEGVSPAGANAKEVKIEPV